MKNGIAAICAGALTVSLLVGCGREVQPPSLVNAQAAFAQGETYFGQGQLQSAEQSYMAAFKGAEAALKTLVPGDKLLVEAEKLRGDSSAQIARIREELRKQEVTATRQVASGPKGVSIKNLPPPVAPYALAAPEKVPGTPTPTPTPTPSPETPKPPEGEKPTTPPVGTEPPKTDPPAAEPPAEPAKSKGVRITKVVLKDNKAVLIHWTLTNLSTDKNLNAGAPAGKVLNKRGGTLVSAFQTFQADGFQYNAADPGACTGKQYVVDGSNLRPGEGRGLVTVVLVNENQAAQVGGASVELRMSEGEDLTDKRLEVVSE